MQIGRDGHTGPLEDIPCTHEDFGEARFTASETIYSGGSV